MKKPQIVLGKFVSSISRTFNLGNGSTWPGHIALNINKNFISEVFATTNTKIVLVTGTNGKTTTVKMIETILKQNGKSVFTNTSGANLLNGAASAIVINSSLFGKLDYDFAIFEIDENNLSLFVSILEPSYIIALNLFRDQLDRYGEIDTIAKKWKDSYNLLNHSELILNADDPLVSYLGHDFKGKVHYFGLNSKQDSKTQHEHASDSVLCPRCGTKLTFEAFYFSHLGRWKCPHCNLKRPKPEMDTLLHYPIPGTYAKYDALAAGLFSKLIGINAENTQRALAHFKPAFGRQEEIKYKGRYVKLLLSKNPTSFNESLRTIAEQKPKNLLIALNDRVPDGRDVSWIWDIDFENLITDKINLIISGDRAYELALRLKYAGIELNKEYVLEKLADAIEAGIKNTNNEDTLYVLPTYTAMLETRKILTGSKVL